MEEVKWERHDLVYLTPEGKRQAFRYGEKEAGDSYSRECFQKTISRCPGIVRRQEHTGDGPRLLQLGFSWYERRGGSRMRFASQAAPEEIVRLEKPWEVCTGERHMKNQKLEQRLRAVLEEGKKRGIRLGVFGSCALELATGLPYTDECSDLDLIVVWDGEKIRDFYENCREITGDIGLDLEILFPDQGSVKAAEWFSGAYTLLIKDLSGPRLIGREELEQLR